MIKQNPFSLYDFLGYFIPGSTLIYSVLVYNKLKDWDTYSLEATLDHFGNVGFEKVLIFIIFSYLTGHLISFLSSISIEKLCNWKYGYPSKYLLGFRPVSYFHSKGEKVEGVNKRWRIIIRFLFWPCWLWDKLFNLKKNYTIELDAFMKKSIKNKLKLLYEKLKLESIESFDKSDFHRIVNHYTYEKNTGHQFKMVNYVSLYGLLRNICLVVMILHWYFIYLLLASFCLGCKIDWSLLLITLALSLVVFISMAAFVKFYRRYSLEGLMLLVSDKDL